MSCFESHLRTKTYWNVCRTRTQITMWTDGKLNSKNERTFLKIYVNILIECLTIDEEILHNKTFLMIKQITGQAYCHLEKINEENFHKWLFDRQKHLMKTELCIIKRGSNLVLAIILLRFLQIQAHCSSLLMM